MLGNGDVLPVIIKDKSEKAITVFVADIKEGKPDKFTQNTIQLFYAYIQPLFLLVGLS